MSLGFDTEGAAVLPLRCMDEDDEDRLIDAGLGYRDKDGTFEYDADVEDVLEELGDDVDLDDLDDLL